MLKMINKLIQNKNLQDSELQTLLTLEQGTIDAGLFDAADSVRKKIYGNKVYIRGLIEISNYCKNNCYYCGIRRDNIEIERYRLTEYEILSCAENGYNLGFRTFVLQGGEDNAQTDEFIGGIVSEIKKKYPDCAVTLSLGEKSYESYKFFRENGADRYLLRHETANSEHYRKLHPAVMSLDNRKKCLFNLKELGFAVGSGFMVGSPYQTVRNIIEDLRFLQELQPDMLGIGPYLTHRQTPFRDFPGGGFELTLRLIAILRLMFPHALIPATTALGTISPTGREQGLKAGANVVMPNLSPVAVRELYELYDDKICTGEEAAECRYCLERRVKSAGYEIVVDRGDAYVD
jgi:biotin synthase